MAMKDFDNTNPQTNDEKWREKIAWLDKKDCKDFRTVRIVGGVFSSGRHWVKFNTEDDKGNVKEKMFPVECCNWNQDTDRADLDNGCVPCEVQMYTQSRYFVNIIDREIQANGKDPIRAVDIPPTLVRKIMGLKKLNVVNNVPTHVNDLDNGRDLHIQFDESGKRPDWNVQMGDRIPLTEEERELELIDFDEYYKLPDNSKVRADFVRLGLINAKPGTTPTKSTPVKTVEVPEDNNETLVDTPTQTKAVMTNLQNQTVTTESTEPVSTTVQEQPVQKVVEETAPVSTPTSGVAAHPPVQQEVSTERPYCFADPAKGKSFLGVTKCITCKHKPACLAASE